MASGNKVNVGKSPEPDKSSDRTSKKAHLDEKTRQVVFPDPPTGTVTVRSKRESMIRNGITFGNEDVKLDASELDWTPEQWYNLTNDPNFIVRTGKYKEE